MKTELIKNRTYHLIFPGSNDWEKDWQTIKGMAKSLNVRIPSGIGSKGVTQFQFIEVKEE